MLEDLILRFLIPIENDIFRVGKNKKTFLHHELK